MRPIDTIKSKIDSDLTKYHSTTLCKITGDGDIKSIRGVGLCALVTPINKYNEGDTTTSGNENTYPVIIVNKPNKWLESNVADKYYVMTLNPVTERASVALGFLISKTAISDLNVWRKSLDDRTKPKDDTGRGLESKTEEFISDDY